MGRRDYAMLCTYTPMLEFKTALTHAGGSSRTITVRIGDVRETHGGTAKKGANLAALPLTPSGQWPAVNVFQSGVPLLL